MKKLWKYVFTPKEKKILRDFLDGKKSFRVAGKLLKCSHQQVGWLALGYAKDGFKKWRNRRDKT